MAKTYAQLRAQYVRKMYPNAIEGKTQRSLRYHIENDEDIINLTHASEEELLRIFNNGWFIERFSVGTRGINAVIVVARSDYQTYGIIGKDIDLQSLLFFKDVYNEKD